MRILRRALKSILCGGSYLSQPTIQIPTTFAEDAAKEQLWQRPPVWHCPECDAPMASWTEEQCPNQECPTNSQITVTERTSPTFGMLHVSDVFVPNLYGILLGLFLCLVASDLPSISGICAGIAMCSFVNCVFMVGGR